MFLVLLSSFFTDDNSEVTEFNFVVFEVNCEDTELSCDVFEASCEVTEFNCDVLEFRVFLVLLSSLSNLFILSIIDVRFAL